MLSLEEKNNILSEAFSQQGYVIVPKAISSFVVDNIVNKVDKRIQRYSKELGYRTEKYLSAVSRWGSPSCITEGVMEEAQEDIEKVVSQVLRNKVLLKKWNIICKNAYCFDEIPYHQDISYSPKTPYQITAWLALHDIDENAGPLEVCPGTHKRPIKPAVDFWSLTYKKAKIKGYKLLVQKGDIILFDSRLWHGSSKNYALVDRYALVSRWSSINFKFSQPIPEIQPYAFGMWTCGKETEKLLLKGARIILKKDSRDFIGLLDLWRQAVETGNLPFKIDRKEVKEKIIRLRILHLACLKHNGGDAVGTVYKELWYSFLSHLERYMEEGEK